VIEVRDVRAGYVPGAPVLKDVSLEVEEGEIVTILGPNGSGKSTLLKTIMGYLRPTAGEIRIDGESMRGAPVHERAIAHGIGYVPQLDNVFAPLTVRENLELGGARLSRAERRRRIAELVELYPMLGERLRQRAETQSGGERQMLATARALMTRPRCLLLDEPSAGLAPLMVEQVFAMLAELRAREGVTILVVEQNAADSLSAADRGIVLVLGEVALSGRASELLDDPRVSELYLGGATELSAEERGPEASSDNRTSVNRAIPGRR
jgi:branched-chain amino acid transport system ATP-binding protein